MTLREFWRYHFLKTLLAFVAIQIGIIAFIQNFNHKPLAVSDSTTMVENEVLKVNPIVNDTDKDEETELSIASFDQPLHGTTEQKGHSIIYTPEPEYFGLDSFAYTVTDGKKVSEPAYVSIEVFENQPAELVPDEVMVYSGLATSIDALANDKDNENDSLYLNDFTQPLSGSLKQDGNSFIYTASSSQAMVDSFTYTVNDGNSISKPTTVVINVLPKSHDQYPWLSRDIGNAAIKGSTAKKEGEWTLTGSGADIWNNEDGFRYVYQAIDGDCEMVAKVESLEGTNGWAKTGIMIRENLSGGSKHSFIVLSNSNGATVHQRTTANSGTSGTEKHPAEAPYWVKIKRKGDKFSYSISENGTSWNTIEELENPMPKKVYIGVVCTSHNNGEIATAVYSHLKVTR